MFEPKNYWDNRLSKNYSLNSVGDITMGRYNLYLYYVRKYVFHKIFKKLGDLNNKSVADIGPGTGFYINLWSKKKVGKIYGIDISKHAVVKLSEKYNSNRYTFVNKDVGTEPTRITDIDIVTAFDILYHIIDDKKYLAAMQNINKMLKTNGIFVFSDNLIRGQKDFRREHQVCRNKKFVYGAIEKSGFEIIYTRPMFVLMNQSFNPKNFFTKYTFPYAALFIRKNVFFAHLFGIIMLPVELLLVSIIKNSYSTEIVVCKKVKNV